jgi:hypothetical protein
MSHPHTLSNALTNTPLPPPPSQALHKPSAESGIGVGGRPRDTAFKLYPGDAQVAHQHTDTHTTRIYPGGVQVLPT